MTETGYLHDILDQPRALRATVAGLRAQSIPEDIRENIASRAYQRVTLTGMGSSLTGFHPLYNKLTAAEIPAVMAETSELIYALPRLIQGDTLVIAASQSGRSAEIVALLDRLDPACTLVGVTNTAGSPLAARADACVLTEAGEESTVSCKTYLAQLAANAWLGAELLGEPSGAVLNALDAAVEGAAHYLASWRSHVEALKPRLQGIRDVFIVGRGDSLASALTGGLITKESTHVHGEGMSSAGFRHGPFEMVGPSTFVLIFEGSQEMAPLNRKLYADIRAAGGAAALVGAGVEDAALRIPEVAEAARPLVEMLPVQMMTLALAEVNGHTAGKFSLATKVTSEE